MLKRKTIAAGLSLILLASIPLAASASNSTEQEASLSLSYETPTTNYQSNDYTDYITYRTPLTNTYKKLTEDKELTVVYLGGSLTAGTGLSNAEEKELYSWRGLSGAWLRENFPDANINTISTAIGESGTFLGTYRVQEDVIANKPDLLFIEYAINDTYKKSDQATAALQFETIVREVREALPECDIVTLLTTDKNRVATSYNLELFPTAQGHSDIAAAYDLPVLNIGSALVRKIAEIENNTSWWTDTTLWNKYFTDIVHLTKAGYEQYWLCVQEFLVNSLKHTDYTGLNVVSRALPTLQSAHLLDGNRQAAMGINMQELYVPESSVDSIYNINRFYGGNDTPHYGSYNVKLNGTITFKFNGTEFAIWTNLYDDSTISYVIDGGTAQTMNCDAHAPTQVVTGLKSGEHTISITPTSMPSTTPIMKIGGVFVRDESKQTTKAKDAVEYEVDTYKANGTYPTQAGKVFAGWYTDDTCTTPYTQTTGNAWAKFVDANVLSVKKQLSTNTTSASSSTNIRFITSIDTLKFRCVGFEVSIEAAGKNYDMRETTAYTSIQVEDGVIMQTNARGTFGSTAKYFVVHSLSGIPKSAFGHEIVVKPYWYTMDGTKVYGATDTFTVNGLINVGNNHQDNDIADTWTIND